jgi:myo-inositol-1(or 4)-monophosphatase
VSGVSEGAIVASVDLSGYLDFAAQTAYEAGRLTLGYFRTEAARPDWKADETPVTAADREAERLIRARISKEYPDHAVVGEEYGEEGESSHRWILDPIDGTKAFVRGVPLYAVLIGLEIEDVCEVGTAYFPALDEMLCAATGLGCRLNGRRTKVSETRTLGDGVVCFTDYKSFGKHGREEEFVRLASASGGARGWSDAYGHALVATGRADLMLDPALNPWDCAPFPPILREAGGYFGDWSGNEGTIYANEGISTTRGLLPEVLRLIEER